MKKSHFIMFILGLACFIPTVARTVSGPYLDSSLSPDQRTADLLRRMTLEEKVGQLLCPLGWEMWQRDGSSVGPSQKFRDAVASRHIGMLWATFRADPWTRKTLANGLDATLSARCANALQRYVIENTRLGIPIFLAEEAPHGHMAIGATVFPTGIAMAATWDTDLIRDMGAMIGREVRTRGAHISYGPVLDLARDARWGRVEETFGEDPFLAGEMGASMVTGLGGGKLSEPYATIATLKHFLAYGSSESGQNGNYTAAGMRDLLQYFLPPFRRAVEAGALSIMTSYNSIDGIPCTANSFLLRDVLLDDWKFRGFTVSDLYSIEGLYETHAIAADSPQAACRAIEAGCDVDLGGDAYVNLIKAVQEGRIDVSYIDKAVAHVLRLKFEMGLFENPYVDVAKAAETMADADTSSVTLRAAREAVVLLKNSASVLPLGADIKRVAVVGPSAHNVYNLLGDYTAPQPADHVTTVLDGFRQILGDDRVIYAKGCAVRDTASADIQQAVDAALSADAVVAVVGGSSARDFDTEYIATGAAVINKPSISDMDCGEGCDRSSTTLLGCQLQLLEALKATGKPLIVVYIEGRPMDKNWAADNADALLTAFYPGQAGGRAIAEVITGRYNPAGRLPMTVARSVGQLPLFYNKRAPKFHNYIDCDASPLYCFGYGLSYTDFAYSDLQLARSADGGATVSFTVTNIGNVDGSEVPQLYVRDLQASVVQPLKQLKGFTRVHIPAGESTRISFSVSPEDLSIVDARYRTVFEPGEFLFMVGPDSDTVALSATIAL